MKKYNYFQALILSFFSKLFYRDVGQNWFGTGLLYLFFLAIVINIPLIYRYYEEGQAVISHLNPYITQVPTITLEKGEVSIDSPSPQFIKDQQSGEVIAIIDTSGQYTSLENQPAKVLLTKNQLFVKWDEHANTYDLTSHHDGVYTQERIRGLINFFGNTLVVVTYFVVAFILFFWCALAALLFAGIVKLATHTTLSFKTLVRLAAVGLTPAVILAMIFRFFFIQIPFIWLLYLAISLAYLFYGMEANKQTAAPVDKQIQ